MEFVDFNLAKKLKEKGFKEKCIAYYWEKINEHTASFLVEDNIPEDGLSLLDLLSNHNQAEWSPFIDAPTISQALKWLREKKKIVIVIRLYSTNGWYWFIQDEKGELKSSYLTSCDDCFATYELTALDGIKYVLDNLI